MKLTKRNTIGNTVLFRAFNVAQIAAIAVSLAGGIALYLTPMFQNNIPALVAYFALCLIVFGRTPTGRSMFPNIIGILFTKPKQQVVTEFTTTATFGHGIKEVILDESETNVNAPAFRIAGKNAFVFNVTGYITRWSGEDVHDRDAVNFATLQNMMEGGECLYLVETEDNNTGMVQLRDYLLDNEKIGEEDDDLRAMSDVRKEIMTTVATGKVGMSVQQFAVVLVKPKNTHRVLKQLEACVRIMTPATNPGDILLCLLGQEGGVNLGI